MLTGMQLQSHNNDLDHTNIVVTLPNALDTHCFSGMHLLDGACTNMHTSDTSTALLFCYKVYCMVLCVSRSLCCYAGCTARAITNVEPGALPMKGNFVS